MQGRRSVGIEKRCYAHALAPLRARSVSFRWVAFVLVAAVRGLPSNAHEVVAGRRFWFLIFSVNKNGGAVL